MGGMAEPATGKAGTETKVASQPLPDTIGNVTHDFSTLDGIRAWRPNND